jgi:hypothetical protein
MRFEAKHQYFKIVAGALKNYKNLPKTLSERHQKLLLCYNTCNQQHFSTFYLGDAIQIGTTGNYEQNEHVLYTYALAVISTNTIQ